MDSKEIHNQMLDDISNDYDKRVGSFIFDATKPSANQLEQVYKRLDSVTDKLDLANLKGDDLERRIRGKTGIERRQATYAIGTLLADGNGTINEGDLFETESGTQFEATETVIISDSGLVSIRAVEAGDNGNVLANTINHMPVTLDNIDSVTNPEPTYDGFDEEDDASLLQRHYERVRTPATSGNKHHYYNWAKEVEGVGDAKIEPLWDGDNTVRVVIIDANKPPSSNELVDEVQQYIDPDSNGLGEGQAPIGAHCTVDSALGIEINIDMDIVIADGYDQQDIVDAISNNVTDYLKDIAFKQDFVSYAQIGAIIIDVNGVEDYTDLTINNDIDNVTINDDEVAILGGVTVD